MMPSPVRVPVPRDRRNILQDIVGFTVSPVRTVAGEINLEILQDENIVVAGAVHTRLYSYYYGLLFLALLLSVVYYVMIRI